MENLPSALAHNKTIPASLASPAKSALPPNRPLPYWYHIGLRDEQEYVLENISMLLSAGLSLLAAISAIKKELHTKRMKNILDVLAARIDGGSTFSEALSDLHLFSNQTISLLRIGELSGHLDENLQIIVQNQDKQRLFRSRIRTAMMYPTLVLSVATIVGLGITWFILPRLALVFSQLQLPLPFITRLLVAAGKFLALYGAIFLPSVVTLLAVIIYIAFFNHHSRWIGQYILLHIPGVHRLMQEIEISQATYTLGTLLETGLPIVDAYTSLVESTSLVVYKKLYEHMRQSVEAGNTLQKTFADFPTAHKLIPGPVQQMLITSEQSGKLSETLLKISKLFEDKSETTTKNLSVILEPILLILVWLAVAAIALAVIVPIYNLIGSLNH